MIEDHKGEKSEKSFKRPGNNSDEKRQKTTVI